MKKPSNIVFGVTERPPHFVTALSGLQHVGLMSLTFLYPVLIAQASGSSADVASAMVSLAMVALAVGAILQVIPIGPFGSGYLCPPIPSVVYLVPSIIAAKQGGLALVFGMTIAAGLLEVLLSRILRRLRPMFPPEIAGLVVLLVGLSVGSVGLRVAFGAGDQRVTGDATALAIVLITLATMVALNVWGRRGLRLFSVLIGMAVGYTITAALGRLGAADVAVLANSPIVAFPNLEHVGWKFDPAVALPFIVAAVASTIKVMGNVTTCQKASDTEWVRADMRSISRGVLADGCGTVLAGAMGASGVNTSTASVGLASATGVLSRNVAYAIAGVLILFAFVPKLGIILYIMPKPVAGAALIFSSTFMIVNGFEIITSRLLDPRKTLMVGLALVIGLAADVHPELFKALPEMFRAVAGTSLVLGTLIALGLNFIFRIGLRKTERLSIPLGPQDPRMIEEFMEKQGKAWGARRDVIDRATFNLTQSIETILDGCEPNSPLEVEASFDEFNLDVRVTYTGPPLELPEKRPTNEEIIESEEGQRRLAGFLLRRFADRVAAMHKAGRSSIVFHFDH